MHLRNQPQIPLFSMFAAQAATDDQHLPPPELRVSGRKLKCKWTINQLTTTEVFVKLCLWLKKRDNPPQKRVSQSIYDDDSQKGDSDSVLKRVAPGPLLFVLFSPPVSTARTLLNATSCLIPTKQHY